MLLLNQLTNVNEIWDVEYTKSTDGHTTDTRVAYDYTRSTHEDIGTAYDVDANGTRRPHDGLGVKCTPECVPKASRDYPMLCKNQLNTFGLTIIVQTQLVIYVSCKGIVYFMLGSRLGVLAWSWAAVLERKFGVEQEMQVNTFF